MDCLAENARFLAGRDREPNCRLQDWYAKPLNLNPGPTRQCARNLTKIVKATSLYQREVTLSCDDMRSKGLKPFSAEA